MPTTRRRKASLLGCLSLIMGIIALLATHTSLAGAGPATIGVVGAAIGLLGLLSAVIIGHTGRVLPVFAILICLAAAGYGLCANGHDDEIKARVTSWINQWHASGSQPAASDGHGSNSTAGRSSSSLRSDSGGGSGQSIGHGSIFDMSAPGKSEPPNHANPSPGAAAIGNAPAVPGVVKPAGVEPTLLIRRTNAQAAIRAARMKLDAAQKTLIGSLSSTPEYQSAKAEVDAAEANLTIVHASSDPGSAQVIAASTRALNSRIALQILIAAASATDPKTSVAQREYADAQRTLISIKAEQDAAAGKKP